MLFNSFPFLFLFLPVTAATFFILARKNSELAAGWLAIASLFFYGWWSAAYIPLLLASIGFNYWAGWKIGHAGAPLQRRWLTLAVSVNLLLLAYFKYANFFLANINSMARTDLATLDLVLPIGISFYTFTQIAFLVDTYKGHVKEYRFVHYLLFITYFPHLIAGPVLHHKEMMPQFAERATYRFSSANLAVGITIFAIGLAKKVLVADNLAPHANALFGASDAPSLLVAWGGVLAYAFQLYFDFSGYCDMAIGVSRLFGVRLPLNFNSPYKASSIIDFWRRWHMTLSRFLRDYLYIALGGNRHGGVRRYANLMITMTLGGLWHGASWNFVVWGALHGAFLVVNHGWITLAGALHLRQRLRGFSVLGSGLTFIAVCTAWACFRAADLARARQIIEGMYGLHGIGLPESLAAYLGSLRPLLAEAGLDFYLGGGTRFVQTWAWTTVAAAIAFFLPNTQQIMGRFQPALDVVADTIARRPSRGALFLWTPATRWAVFVGACLLSSLLSLTRPAEFLYFQF
jgi:alginate O-acetyltransferase complex protein AlgI